MINIQRRLERIRNIFLPDRVDRWFLKCSTFGPVLDASLIVLRRARRRFHGQLKVSIGLTAVQHRLAEASDINLVLRGSSFSKGVRGDRDSLLSIAAIPVGRFTYTSVSFTFPTRFPFIRRQGIFFPANTFRPVFICRSCSALETATRVLLFHGNV